MTSVYVGLTADILHPGIFRVLDKADSLGEVTVGLLTDGALSGYKRIPAFDWNQRSQMLQGIRGVVRVVPQEEWSYVPNLLKIRPDFFVHGDDWLQGPDASMRDDVILALSSFGGTLVEVPYTNGVSSSQLRISTHEMHLVPELRINVLRRLIISGKLVRVIEAHNPLAAIIAQSARFLGKNGQVIFDALWSSSLADSLVQGLPDNETLDFSSRLHVAEQILRRTQLPLVFDGDTGGQPDHLAYRVRLLEQAGVGAIVVEDKRGQKRNSLIEDSSLHILEDIGLFCDKIKAAKQAQRTDGFQMVARVEALVCGQSINEALARSERYVESGADAILIHSKQSSQSEVTSFAAEFRRQDSKTPLVAVPTTYSQVTELELEEAGFNMVIYANHLVRASVGAMERAARGILESQSASTIENLITSVSEVIDLSQGTR